MLAFTLFKGFTSILVAGTAIFIPTYLSTKSTSVSLVSQVKTQAPTSTRETVPTSQRQIEQDEKFNDCLDQKLKVKVRKKNGGEERIILLTEQGTKYPSSEWDVVGSAYDLGSCSRSVEN